MTKVVIENIAGKSIDVNSNSKSLLHTLLEHTDWLHSCGGKGRCTTCKAIIVHGDQFLSDMTSAELNYMKLEMLATNERLTCQVRISGPVVIRVPNESKLPHITYSDDVY